MQENKFKLSRGATELFNKTARAIREGIANVSELRLRENKTHSLSKVDFEKAYIQHILGGAVSRVAADTRGMTDILTKQADEQAEAVMLAIKNKGAN
jgi:hypothetical protein